MSIIPGNRQVFTNEHDFIAFVKTKLQDRGMTLHQLSTETGIMVADLDKKFTNPGEFTLRELRLLGSTLNLVVDYDMKPIQGT